MAGGASALVRNSRHLPADGASTTSQDAHMAGVLQMTESPSRGLVVLGCTERVWNSFADWRKRDGRVVALARVVRVERSRSIIVEFEGRDLRVKASIPTVV